MIVQRQRPGGEPVMKKQTQSRSDESRSKKKRAPKSRGKKNKCEEGPSRSFQSETGTGAIHGIVLTSSGLMPEDLERAAKRQELHATAAGRRPLQKRVS